MSAAAGNRWIIYQRERFPIAAHAPLVAAFSGSAVCFSSLVRGHTAWPSPKALTVAFATSLLFFLQLRIADEFKDFEDDSRYRPYRPVPRGLVTLRELAWLGAGGASIQLALALWLEPSIVWLLIITWAYLAVMTREFFVPRWLKAHPVIYMASHMVILPLIDMYATACDWWVVGYRQPPPGLFWFLIVSFFNGVVVEIGRKIRAREDEEEGVETYSSLWGVTGAVRAWLGAIALTGFAAWRAAERLGTAAPTAVFLGALVAACVAIGVRFAKRPSAGGGKTIELMSGVWTLLMYLGLGAVPLTMAVWRTVAA
ncbi:MAG TPA: UbiA family prenyltransferase [Vicinamibacterales bacterium]|jgi:4-hydroxybenzoate polyprenyltransferase|nr:UbiA family prenyltransferase [Vicinamibacterales bacterium]